MTEESGHVSLTLAAAETPEGARPALHLVMSLLEVEDLIRRLRDHAQWCLERAALQRLADRTFQLDGHVVHLEGMVARGDLRQRDLEELERLAVGNELLLGGGAAPGVHLVRVA